MLIEKKQKPNLSSPNPSSYKFFPPQSNSTSIKRRRLLSNLIHQKKYSAIIIQAPAGHGKTTLMQQLKQHFDSNSFNTGWLSLDEGDNDISHFNAMLKTLFTSLVAPEDTSALSSAALVGSGSIENLLHLLSVSHKPTAIFIDEYQAVTEPVNTTLLETLIERSPPNIYFYIGSRAIPDFANGRLLIGGQIHWVKPEEMCFDLEETKEFFNLVGLSVEDNDTAAFLEQTGGWPAILQLLHLALKGGQVDKTTLFNWVKGCRSQLASYLADNVMSNQPEERKAFLLKTAPLTRLTAPLCEAITGYPSAERILDEVVSEGLFIQPIGFDGRWFKYHALFSAYLTEQLEIQNAEEVTRIHRTASAWFQDHGYFEEAIEHALKAREYNRAATAFDKWMPALVCSARLQTIDKLCSRIPEHAYFNRPFMSWGRIWAKYFLSERPSASRYLADWIKKTPRKSSSAQLRQSLDILRCIDFLQNDEPEKLAQKLTTIDYRNPSEASYKYFEMGVLANLNAISSLHHLDFPEAKRQSVIGESKGIQGKTAFSSAYSTSLLALTLLQEGRLLSAVKKLKARLDSEDLKVQGSFATASLSAIYGLALYESGQLIEAESHLSDTIDVISKTLPQDWVILAVLSLFRARTLLENSTLDSMELLDDAEKRAHSNNLSRLLEAIEYEHYRVSISDPESQKPTFLAAAVSDIDASRTNYHFLCEGSHDAQIHELRLLVNSGYSRRAIEIIGLQLEDQSIQHWLRRKIKLMILLALAYYHDNQDSTAKTVLTNAISLAEPQSYVCTFLEEGNHCLTLLSSLKLESRRLSSFVDKIFALTEHETSVLEIATQKITAQSDLIEQLTKREMKILNLVANGASNKEIADQCFISYNTVKFHMKNLYGKLGAKNRVGLITEATRLKLI